MCLGRQTIVIRPDLEIGPIMKLGHELHGLTRINQYQLESTQKFFFKKIKVLIFHIIKLRNNSCEYRLDML